MNSNTLWLQLGLQLLYGIKWVFGYLKFKQNSSCLLENKFCIYMLLLTHQVLQQLDDTGQVVGSDPLLADVDLGHRRCLLTPQWYSVDLNRSTLILLSLSRPPTRLTVR